MGQRYRTGHDARHKKERRKKPDVLEESVPRTRFGTGRGTDDQVLGDKLADDRLEVLRRLKRTNPQALETFIRRSNLSRGEEAIIRMVLGAGADSEAALPRQKGSELDLIEGPQGVENAIVSALEENPDLVHPRVKKRDLQ